MALTPEKINAIKAELAGLSPEEQKEKLQEILESLPSEEQEQLVGKQQCPFCLMASGQIPVKKVYEDSDCIAILDINPANKGHMLLFPKKHYGMMAQMEDKEAGMLYAVANKLSKAVFEGLKASGSNIVVGNGAIAGQRAPHALINIIPRFDGDKVVVGWNPVKLSDDEMDDALQQISAHIPREQKNEEPVKIVKKASPAGFRKRLP